MDPIAVSFPLRGEWVAPNTPGHRVPSHGTDLLAQTYAYDFLQIDWRYPDSYRFFEKPLWRALAFGVPLRDCLGWSQPILAPFSGKVVEAVDGVEERDPVHLVRELLGVVKNGLFFKPESNAAMRNLLGNFLILEGENCFAFLAHARHGSISVREGERIESGARIAEVGHSGNSTAPHLHFQLMDGPLLLEAKGLPCCFKEYELFEGGHWRRVQNGIPGRREHIRVR